MRTMLKEAESWLAAILAIAALFLFLSGMMFRSLVPRLAGGWIEELTIYLVVWALFLAAAGAVAHRGHVATDFLIRLLPDGIRRSLDILADVTGLVFCAALAWMGWLVVDFALLLDERGPSMLQIPRAWYYAALPVSMALMSLRYLLAIFAALTGRPPADPAH